MRRERLNHWRSIGGKSQGLGAHKPPGAQIHDGQRPDTEAGRVVGLLLPTHTVQLAVGLLKAEIIHQETFTR